MTFFLSSDNKFTAKKRIQFSFCRALILSACLKSLPMGHLAPSAIVNILDFQG
jgi:hypothetical protein